MNNVLIYCNTHYQILMAIHIALTIHKESIVDAIISDHISDGNRITEKLKHVGVFNEVYYFNSIDVARRKSKIKGILDIIKYSIGATSISFTKQYSEIIAYNFDISTYELLNFQEKNMQNCIWSKMDEGIFSYNTQFYLKGKRYQSISKVRSLLGKKKENVLFEKYYCCFPELLNTYKDLELVMVPSLEEDMQQLRGILSYIYDQKSYGIKEKYIFFASSGSIDSYDMQESSLIKKIVDKVGSNSVVIKKHPRDNTDFFETYGLKMIETSGVPWEAFHIINGFYDKIFLTVSSGAFITSSAWLRANNKAIFLLPEIKVLPNSIEEYVKNIRLSLDRLHNIGLCTNMKEGKVDDI